MRSLRTSGSVGGLVGQPLALPGSGRATADALWPAQAGVLWPAAHRDRWVARAAGGRRQVVPTRGSGGRCWRGPGRVPGVRGRRGAAGRPGSGGTWPKRAGLAPPNFALERTGHSGRFVAGAGRYPVARRSPRPLGGPRGRGPTELSGVGL